MDCKVKPSSILTLILSAVVVCLLPTVAAGQASVEERLLRLENVVNSDTLIDLLQQVERLQREVQELRGEVEVQAYELSTLKNQQREQYLDIDTRVGKLEMAPVVPSETMEPVGATTEPVPVVGDPAKEQDTYQSAFDLLKARRYDQAIAAFEVFLQEYPNGALADNARYWLGEAYYVSLDFDAALLQFNTLVETHPDSPKVSHAWLKIGFIQDDLGHFEAAAATLQKVIDEYPDSSAAEFAQERLAQMEN